MTQEHIVFGCIESKGNDEYYEINQEADYSTEGHRIKSTTRYVEFKTTYERAKEMYNEYMEQNADNPPYDTYKIIVAYDENTREVLALDMFRE